MSTSYYERLVTEDLDLGAGTVTKRNPGGGSLVGTQVGIHSIALGKVATETTWDPSSISNGASATTTVTVTGASLGDFSLVSFSLSLGGLTLSSYVSATNTVMVVLGNLTGAAVDLSSGSLRTLVFQSR